MIEDQDPAALEDFGPYLVYERLGVGGMATVHRALERGIEGFERVVALKRLLPHLAEDASFIKSFVREAKLASMLQHANIVQILELGRVGPTYFISMEYIDGRDIRRVLRHARKVSGPPPINVTLALMLQLCDALDYAHNRCDAADQPLGLVHRDLSPSNLLLTRSGHLKVIDFGIAKAQSAQLRTQTGRVKGKLAYMAPEAIAGKELDARSDLFSAGVVFHELLTARPLFAQKNEYQTLLKVQRGEVGAPSVFNEGVPKELDDIVLRALARDPEDRWPNAAQLRDALVTVRMARQLSATPRDVTQWCDWAFSLEPPSAGFSGKTFTEGLASGGNSFGGHVSPVRAATPRPRPASAPSMEEEAAAEIAWGVAEHESGVVHLHEDVPDVSGKIIAPSAIAAGAIEVGLSEPITDDQGPAYDPSMMDPGQTAPEMSAASTIKTHAVPPPGPRTDQRPAAFPAGSSDDALLRARPRSSSVTPVAMPPIPPIPAMRAPSAHGSIPPSTRPGGRAVSPAPATARGSTTSLLDDLDAVDTVDSAPAVAAIMPPRARAGTSSPPPIIGAAIAARTTPHLRNAIIALVVLGIAATGITLAITVGDDEVPAVNHQRGDERGAGPARTTGTLKFNIEPADAVITIGETEPHPGSPWQTEVAEGTHQVEIHRDGYKTWLTKIELSAGETQTLRVVLEKVGVGGAAAAATATLVVDPSMPGLEVMLDGQLLDQRTPVRMEVKLGPHHVALHQDGAEVWAEDFTAVANATHEFDPSMSDDKKQERKHHHADDDIIVIPRRPTPPPAPTIVAVQPTPAPAPAPAPGPAAVKPAPTVAIAPAIGTSRPPGPTVVTPPKPEPGIVTPTPPRPEPVKIAPTPTPVPVPVPVARPTGPVVVPPTAVTRTSGSVPSIRSRDGSATPAAISAKVCIDTGGGVTSAHVLSKVPDDVKEKLEDAIRGWRYSTYKQGGSAVAACFVASFRSK